LTILLNQEGDLIMKNIIYVILCSILCLTVAVVLPQSSVANEYVDSSSECLTCHSVSSPGTGSAGEQHYDHSTVSCASCHDGAPGIGNVQASSCTVCHLAKCESVTTHESDHGASCLSCHIECAEDDDDDPPADDGNTCPAVAIYGESSEEVELLRTYRDDVLSKTPEGRKLVSLYYSLSPAVVNAIDSSKVVKGTAKNIINAALPGIKMRLGLQ
jgi:hypothetical protein